jgi:hypothetical protein
MGKKLSIGASLDQQREIYFFGHSGDAEPVKDTGVCQNIDKTP